MIRRTKDKIFALSQEWGKKMGLDLNYFVGNGFWIIMRQGVASLCGLSLSIVFARLASKEILGQYQLILSILSIVSLVSIPGLNISILRSVAKGKDGNYQESVKKSFSWSLLGIPIFLVLACYYIFYGSYLIGISLIFIAFIFPFMYATNTWQSFFQGKSRFDLATKFGSIHTVINSLAVIVAIIIFRNNPYILIFITIFYLLSYSIPNYLFYRKSFKYVKNSEEEPETIKYGFFLTRMSILQVISDNIDKIILGVFISPASLAVYYIISLIPIKFKAFLKPFFNLFIPKMVNVNEKIFSIIKSKSKLIILSTASIFVICAFYYFFIEFFEEIFFGQNYAGYYQYSKYYVILLIFFIPLSIFSKYVYAKKYEDIIFATSIYYPLIRIGINIIFIIKLGLLGAVISYNLNIVIWFLFYFFGLYFKEKKTLV